MSPRAVGAAAFLDRRPLDESDAGVKALVEVLIRAYDDEYEALAVAGQVGLLKADIERYPKLRLTWWSIVREAALERQLRRLVDFTLRDPTIESWHPQLRDIVLVPPGAELVERPPRRGAPRSPRRDETVRSPFVRRANLWQRGTILRVRFLGGHETLQKKVESAALQWLDGVNLGFSFGTDPEAQIRVGFERDSGDWAFTGFDCMAVPKGESNVNFGSLTVAATDGEINRVVLHEMGHVLGLLNEYSNPASSLKWDRKKVYKHYAGPPTHWSRVEVDENIFAVWPPGYFPLQKAFDPTSIMMHPQPGKFFPRGQAIGWNTKVSPADRQFVAALYPLRATSRPAALVGRGRRAGA